MILSNKKHNYVIDITLYDNLLLIPKYSILSFLWMLDISVNKANLEKQLPGFDIKKKYISGRNRFD